VSLAADNLLAERRQLIAMRATYVSQMNELMLNAFGRGEPLTERDGEWFDWLMARTRELEATIEDLWIQESAERDRDFRVHAERIATASLASQPWTWTPPKSRPHAIRCSDRNGGSQCMNAAKDGLTICGWHAARQKQQRPQSLRREPAPALPRGRIWTRDDQFTLPVDDRTPVPIRELDEDADHATPLIDIELEQRANSLISHHYNTMGRRRSRRYEGYGGAR
jgi:hypothetical protein